MAKPRAATPHVNTFLHSGGSTRRTMLVKTKPTTIERSSTEIQCESRDSSHATPNQLRTTTSAFAIILTASSLRHQYTCVIMPHHVLHTAGRAHAHLVGLPRPRGDHARQEEHDVTPQRLRQRRDAAP